MEPSVYKIIVKVHRLLTLPEGKRSPDDLAYAIGHLEALIEVFGPAPEPEKSLGMIDSIKQKLGTK